MAIDPKNPAGISVSEMKELISQQEKLSEARKKSIEDLQKENKLLSDRLSLEKDIERSYELQIKQAENKIEIIQKQKQEVEEILKSEKLESDEKEKYLKRLDKIDNAIEKQNDKLKLQRKIYEDINTFDKRREEHFEKLEGIGESFSNKLGLSGNAFKNSLLGVLFDGKEEGFGNISKQLEKIGKGFTKALEPGNLFASLQKKVVQSTILLVAAQDSALSSFNKQTGAAGKYNDMIIDLESSNRALGLDTEKIAKAIEGMRVGFVDFNLAGQQTQKELTLLAASFETFGISAETTGKITGNLVKGLGMSAQQSMQTQKEIFATAKALGIAPSKMANDFASALPKLMMFGDKASQKFKELAVAAKALNTTVDELQSAMEGFQTFEGAAAAASQLNAVFGNIIDSAQLQSKSLNEGPVAAAKYLQDSFKKAGIEAKNLSPAMLTSIAKMNIGFKNASDVLNFLNNDVTKESEATKKAAASQDDLNKMMQQATPIGEKLKSIMLGFAIGLQPVVDALKSAMDWISKMNDATGGKLIPILVGGIGVLALLTKTLNFGRDSIKSVSSVLELLKIKKVKDISLTGGQILAEQTKNAIDKESIGITKAKTSATWASVPAMLALGAAILMAGIGIGIAAYGFAKLAESMKGMGSEAWALVAVVAIIILGFVGLAFALVLLGTTSAAAAIPILAVGAALLLVGGGIALAAWGASTFLKSVKGVLPVLPQMVLLVGALAVSFLALGAAAVVLGFSMPLLMLSIGGLAIALSGIGYVGVSALTALGGMFASLTNLSAVSSSALNNISLSIMNIVAAIDQLPTEKTVAFNSTMEAISSVPEIKRETIENVKVLVDQAVKYRETQENTKSSANNSFTQLVAAASSGGSKSGGGKTEIVIELGDNRVLKKFIMDTVDENLNVRRRY